MSRPHQPDSAAVQVALAAWAVAHPEATLMEIEHEVDRQLGALRASLIGAVAEVSASEIAVPRCPTCAALMHRDRERTVRQATAHGGTVEVSGPTWRCPACGAGLFPPR